MILYKKDGKIIPTRRTGGRTEGRTDGRTYEHFQNNIVTIPAGEITK